MAAKSISIAATFDPETATLAVPVQVFRLGEDSAPVPDPTPDPGMPDTPDTPDVEAPAPPEGLMIMGMDPPQLMWTALVGEVYNLYRTATPDVQPWPRIASGIQGGAYTDHVAKTNADQVLYYTVTAVRLSDAYEGTGADRVSVTVPAKAGTTPTPDPTPDPTPTPTPDPTPTPAGTVKILATVPNVSSVVVQVEPVKGAADYWVYDDGNPASRKAFGGGLIGEFNGPIKGKLIVEALDRLAPFQAHMPMTAAGMAAMPSGALVIKNGHGDPAAVPVVLARSAPLSVTYKGKPTGVLVATFDDPSLKLTKVTDGLHTMVQTASDGSFRIKAFQCNVQRAEGFLSDSHLMLDCWDGGTPGTGEALRQLNGALALEFTQVLDFAGKILHVFAEWDGHCNLVRRWFDIGLIRAEDELIRWDNVEDDFLGHELVKNTTSNDIFLWRVDGGSHKAYIVGWDAANTTKPKVVTEVLAIDWNKPGKGADRGIADRSALNGDQTTLDLRRRFDLYLSETRSMGFETSAMGARKKIWDKAHPTALRFTRARLVGSQKIYHSALDEEELRAAGYAANSYWIDRTPANFMGHIDNVGAEYLTAFPNA